MNSPVKSNIFVEIGEPPNAWKERYGNKVDVNDKNHGLRFYSLDWTTKNPGRLSIKNGMSELRLEAVLGAMGTYNDEYPDEGFSGILITMGLTESDTLAHDEARQRFHAVLRKIQDAGWSRWIYPADPRLRGEEAFRYQINEDEANYSLDPNYLPPMNVWMKLKNRSQWSFYLNKVEMTVTLSRDQDRMKEHLPGAYFISIKMQSQDEIQREEFQENERSRWKSLYPAMRKKRLSERLEVEKKLQLSGYKIDVEYKNPEE